jgi:hypothetical protein
MLRDYLSSINSKSVDIEGLVRKPFNKELFDQSYNICSIFGRNDDK